ncbi:hypothetical protein [Hafnia alvei]|uniref:hypothetical protein n=1 Tax=Hafnia alvei TaxID=569 RepID=UPI001412EAB7|nr:hypothetical protein [Hafnia alvei]QIP56860.1 hypothetical protein HBA19_15125 [Hafnia alvei]
MAKFTVRVELHKADSEDYESLHEKMEAKGYKREVKGSDGKMYQLPNAEYVCDKEKTPSQVRDEVRAISESVKRNPSVLVTESAGRAWRLSEV